MYCRYIGMSDGAAAYWTSSKVLWVLTDVVSEEPGRAESGLPECPSMEKDWSALGCGCSLSASLRTHVSMPCCARLSKASSAFRSAAVTVAGTMPCSDWRYVWNMAIQAVASAWLIGMSLEMRR